MQMAKDHMFGQTPKSEDMWPFFIHANFPKFTPATIFEDQSFGAAGPTRDSDGTYRRVWHGSAADSISCFGFDFERRLWEEIKALACTYEESISN
jgi:alpha 1,2-mannosyltransferase